jgi:hypothetical protein
MTRVLLFSFIGAARVLRGGLFPLLEHGAATTPHAAASRGMIIGDR